MDSYGNRKTNRLINEKSPYLLQHAYNPVDWYPWGNEAFEKAVAEGKPLFLSIGYSTCHWCHVMVRESFEDPEVATLLNKSFVSIKVDREERPDLDQFYMAACQAMTGKGGWPLTVFLTPDKKPFFAGTYFPKHSRYGIFGIVDLLPKLDALWHQDRAQLLHAGGELWTLLQQQGEGTADLKPVGFDLPPVSLIDRACQQLKSAYDHTYGGFGDAPKFPAPHQFMLLLRCWKRTGAADTLLMVVNSLKAMHRGGIFDQLGYGMHRYSVDRQWLVPHFEKMLYDQATVALATLEAYQAVSDPELALFARKIFAYVLQELKSPEGGFFTAEDADTEGEEGTFYVWTPGEIKALLGTEHGQLVAKFFGVTEKGNFENGSSVLHRNFKIEEFASLHGIAIDVLKQILEQARTVLLEARGRRERPFRDDKIITAWNGMLIAALARGASVLEEPEYAEAAAGAADFILARMTQKGRLLRRYRDGEAAIPAFLDDYSCLAWGLLELYRSTFNSRYLEQASRLTMEMLDLFDAGNGRMRYSALSGSDDYSDEMTVYAEAYDGATPSGVSVAAMNLLHLGRILRNDILTEKGKALIIGHFGKLENYPTGHAYLLSALDFTLTPPEELTIVGKQGVKAVQDMVSLVNRNFRPQLTMLFSPSDNALDSVSALCPFLKEMPVTSGDAAAYYCAERRCFPPVTDWQQLKLLLENSGQKHSFS